MKSNHTYRQAVKQELINLAVEDKFPMDLNSLDIDEVFKKAEAKLNSDEAYKRQQMIAKLDNYVSGNNVEEQFNILESLDSKHDKDLADDHLDILHRFEYDFLVEDLWQEIQP